MLLTDAQLHEIRQIIADHHSAFVANVISPRAVSPDTLERLRAKGLLNVQINSVEDAYLYGQLLAALEDPKLSKLGYEQFKMHLKRNPIPLSPIEQRAVQIAEHSAGQYAKGLGNRIDLQTGQVAINADNNLQAKMRDTIRTATAESLAKRETARQLASNLGHETKDWARDWDRIAITEMHNAKERGTADVYAKRFGSGVRVAKRTMPDACEHCKRLHDGPDGHPRIFKLSELERNGTNHGRKAREWKPVVGTVHPHCQCTMVRIPEGWGFDEHDELVPGGAGGIAYNSHEDMELAMREELDLAKSVAMGHVDFQGLPISIENAPGTVRHWHSPEGDEGETLMLFAYGYIDGTVGADGGGLDVYVGPDPRAQMVYIIHQQNPHTGIYDETKCFLGFPGPVSAKAAYLAHFDRPDFFGWMEAYPMEAFRWWLNAQRPEKWSQSGANGLLSDAVFDGELLKRCAFLVKGNRFISWPEAARGVVSLRSARGQSPARKGTVDGSSADLQLARDLTKAATFIPESQGGFYIPESRSPVSASMLSLGQQFQIGGIVVQAIPIAMMHDFPGAERAAQQALHDNPMLKALASIHPDKPILCVPAELSDMATLKLAPHEPDYSFTGNETQPRFVIPLEKSNVPGPGVGSLGNVSPEMVETRADARAPGPGLGANYLFNTPKRTPTPTLRESGFDPAPRELFDNLAMRHKAGRKSKDDYTYNFPLPDGTLARPIELPPDWPALVTEADAPDIEARKKHLIKEGLKNTATVKNTVEITGDEKGDRKG